MLQEVACSYSFVPIFREWLIINHAKQNKKPHFNGRQIEKQNKQTENNERTEKPKTEVDRF